ncbi:MAG: hypothetical protein PHQ58_02405 [Rhodoferax sp.]|uniref:hypothetical protein n=1 Tax=Rhodoferax sp. TaxID=50421 RepID=UPI00261D22B5|nr:hypothetical protein [Rhodoferax sp.]MDD2879263.1 hypothetical protein [Rhodoferax sp.]
MNSIYENTIYRTAFDTEQALHAKVDELRALEGTQRVALGQWTQPTQSQKSAFDKAMQALNGNPATETRDADLKALQQAHIATKQALDAVARGLPEAHHQVGRMRDKLTIERMTQADVKKAIKRSLSAARELLEADKAMNALCDDLSRSGFATGQNERDIYVIANPDALAVWADGLESMQG